MLLTPDQEMIRDAVRDFAQRELWPHAAEWDKKHHFPKDVHKGLAELGAYGICVPEELGGAGLVQQFFQLGQQRRVGLFRRFFFRFLIARRCTSIFRSER